MVANIDYTHTAKDKAFAFGRNGIMHCKGLEISANYEVVMIEPVNKCGVGRCFIQIPVEDIDKVIRALEICKHKH